MALVNYASSSDEDCCQFPAAAPSAKRRRVQAGTESPKKSTSNDLPPLPTNFHDLYATSVRTSTGDNPSLHGGRKRTTPHVVGNWPSHVYLEWYPSTTEVDKIRTVLNAVSVLRDDDPEHGVKVHSLLTSELGAPLPLHISLSASLNLSTAGKDDFLDTLSSALESLHKVNTFEVSLGQLLWAPNYDKTRWFLVFATQKLANDELNLLLQCCNNVCEQQKLPTLYKQTKQGYGAINAASAEPLSSTFGGRKDVSPDRFHFSIGWQLEEPSDRQMKLTGLDDAKVLEEVKGIRVKVDSVKVKIGNTITSVSLRRSGTGKKMILT